MKIPYNYVIIELWIMHKGKFLFSIFNVPLSMCIHIHLGLVTALLPNQLYQPFS